MLFLEMFTIYISPSFIARHAINLVINSNEPYCSCFDDIQITNVILILVVSQQKIALLFSFFSCITITYQAGHD